MIFKVRFQICRIVEFSKSVYTNLLRHPCNICGKDFINGVMFLSYVRTVHEKIKFNICPVCGKAFSQSGIQLNIPI